MCKAVEGRGDHGESEAPGSIWKDQLPLNSRDFCFMKKYSPKLRRSYYFLGEDGNTFFKNYVFLFFQLCWIFIAMCRFPLVVVSRGYSFLWCVGFSCCRAQALGTWPSIVAAPRAQLLWCGGPRVCRLQRLWHRAQIAQGMWNLPRPGVEPVSPALAGGFPSTGPPGKSWKSIFEM